MKQPGFLYFLLMSGVGGVAWLPWLAFNLHWIAYDTLQWHVALSGPPAILFKMAESYFTRRPEFKMALGSIFNSKLMLDCCWAYYAALFLPVLILYQPGNPAPLRAWRKRAFIIAQSIFLAVHTLLAVGVLSLLRA